MDKFNNYLNFLNTKEACKEVIENIKAQVEVYKTVSKLEKAYYDELINTGFTEQQALAIVKYQGINAGMLQYKEEGD